MMLWGSYCGFNIVTINQLHLGFHLIPISAMVTMPKLWWADDVLVRILWWYDDVNPVLIIWCGDVDLWYGDENMVEMCYDSCMIFGDIRNASLISILRWCVWWVVMPEYLIQYRFHPGMFLLPNCGEAWLSDSSVSTSLANQPANNSNFCCC